MCNAHKKRKDFLLFFQGFLQEEIHNVFFSNQRQSILLVLAHLTKLSFFVHFILSIFIFCVHSTTGQVVVHLIAWVYSMATEMTTLSSTLIYQIRVSVQLPIFAKKPWSMFCEYFWSAKSISIDWLDSWPSVWSKSRNQVNQSKSFSLVKNIHQTWIKVLFWKFDNRTCMFIR